MRVLLIDPTFPTPPRARRPHWAPLGLAYLAAVLRQEGHTAVIHSRQAAWRHHLRRREGLDEETRRLLTELRPELVGVGGLTASWPDMQHVVRLARECLPATTIVIGGAQATLLPEETLAGLPEADCLVVGEGERALAALAAGTAPAELRGVHWRGPGGGLGATPWQAPDWPLDGLPLPARDLLDMRWYCRPENGGLVSTPRSALTIASSRGCRHRCAFCAEPAWTVRGVRYHSPERTVAEAESMLADFGMPALYFLDEAFTGDRGRVLELCELWRRRGLHQRVVFGVQARTDALDPELLTALRLAGCRQIDLGVESGSPRMLRAMRKGVTVEQNQAAVAAVKAAGITAVVNLIAGCPGETEEDLRATLEFVSSTDPGHVNLGRFVPLPGTAFTAELVRNGFLAPDFWRAEAPARPPDFSAMAPGRLDALLAEARPAIDARNRATWLSNASWWRRTRALGGRLWRRCRRRQARPAGAGRPRPE